MSLSAVTSPYPHSGFEAVACYYCGSLSCQHLLRAQDDLTGKPGSFQFVTCKECGLNYQSPRLDIASIKYYYDDQYIAHRRKTDWGPLTGFFNYTMDTLDRKKVKLVSRYIQLDSDAEVLDVGCGVGTFLTKVRDVYGSNVTGVDFKDLSGYPGFDNIQFHCGLFYEQNLGRDSFDLITMWHFLEHDYDPIRSLQMACRTLKPEGRLLIEVPRLDSLTYRLFGDRWPGLQAPQHTVLYNREMLLRFLDRADLEVVD